MVIYLPGLMQHTTQPIMQTPVYLQSLFGTDGDMVRLIIPPIRMWELITRYAPGCPVAWMVSSNTTEATIGFFLYTLCSANPSVIMSKIMTDFDWAQINMIMRHYPEGQIFLCWWHVLHAWQQHITISHYLVW